MDSLSKYTNRYRIIVQDSDYRKKMKLGSLFYYLQEIAILHAENLAVGVKALEEKGYSFVLTRLKIEIERYPHLEEEIIVETWPQKASRLQFERDFLVKDTNGGIIARAVSNWVVMDMVQRRVMGSDAVTPEYPEIITDRAIEDFKITKIKEADPLTAVYKKRIGYTDIDINGHVNNVRYIDYICDCFPLSFYDNHQIESLQINYLNEAFAGEVLMMRMKQSDSGRSGETEVYVDGVKDAGDGVEPEAAFRAVLKTKLL